MSRVCIFVWTFSYMGLLLKTVVLQVIIVVAGRESHVKSMHFRLYFFIHRAIT